MSLPIICFECGKVLEFPQEFYGSEHPCCYQCFQRQKKTQEPFNPSKIQTCKGCYKRFYAGERREYCYSCAEALKHKAQYNKEQFTHNSTYNNTTDQDTFDFEELWKIFEQARAKNYSSSSGSTRNYTYAHSFRQNTGSVPQTVKEAFQVLGLEPTATTLEIKKAYKQKALVTHPDTGGSHQEMVNLNAAKELCLRYKRGK